MSDDAQTPENDATLTAGDLTAEHIGMAVLDVPGISGWERHLLLRDIDRREDGLWLHFRWNDDPSPSNAKRGQYAVGRRVDPSAPVRVIPPDGGAS